MASSHFIADRDLTLLGDIAADNEVYTGVEFRAVGAVEHLDIDYGAVLAVRNTERRVLDLSCLFAEYCAEQALLCGKLGLALGRYLTNKYISGTDLRTYADYSALVKVFQCILADVWNVTGDLLRSELGVTRFNIVLLYMTSFWLIRTASS